MQNAAAPAGADHRGLFQEAVILDNVEDARVQRFGKPFSNQPSPKSIGGFTLRF